MCEYFSLKLIFIATENGQERRVSKGVILATKEVCSLRHHIRSKCIVTSACIKHLYMAFEWCQQMGRIKTIFSAITWENKLHGQTTILIVIWPSDWIEVSCDCNCKCKNLESLASNSYRKYSGYRVLIQGISFRYFNLNLSTKRCLMKLIDVHRI